MTSPHPQIVASDPEASAFVTANAGSGKTSTLVNRVARLLLRGARPEAILCVTYTKAAAAEMQQRLFETLGRWAVLEDDALAAELTGIDERPNNLSAARALFARALETPGGLRIQTIHAFCEKLLRRFPLEAGVSPGFQVLEDQAAREVSGRARAAVADLALADPEGRVGRPYARFAVELDHRAFGDMFAVFEARRPAIRAYVDACGEGDGLNADVWGHCGFFEPESAEDLAAAAVATTDWLALKNAAQALLQGSEKSDQPLGLRLMALAPLAGRGRDPTIADRREGEGTATPQDFPARSGAAEDPSPSHSLRERAPPSPRERGEGQFRDLWSVFCTAEGKPRARMATNAVAQQARDWLANEQERLGQACERIKAARVAEDTVAALTLATVYASLYEAAKAGHGGLDFADLIDRTHCLLTGSAGAAAWVLFKLDGGIDHALVDEAQDTAPDQWDIVDALTAEFFAGAGAREAGRTTFAVGDEKQSIFSFQGAAPERFLNEAGRYRSLVEGAGRRFETPSLLESWRSTPEVLSFVDAVFADPQALAALRPEVERRTEAVEHRPTRAEGLGSVELWDLEESEPSPEAEAWTPVDAEPADSANRKLARRLARRIKAMVTRGEAVFDKSANAMRPMGFGDVLILLRRRKALFHEIIRALKREGAPVGGADRLTLSDHIVFKDLVGLGWFCLYPWDDLTLGALLRSPFCDIGEDDLFDLAQSRKGSLWGALSGRADERPNWRAALDFLTWAMTESRRRPPFDFYARLLDFTGGDGRSVRARLLTRLGREAEQALDAFLAEALAAERRGVRDLETFAAEMAGVAVEVKREQEDGKGEVRVMTVHGAKGLEAPVVILPDTATRATVQGGPLLDDEEGFLWCARKGDDCEASAAARRRRSDRADHESLRLLYVAMTRARDRLIIAGVKPSRESDFQGSWRQVAERALERPSIAPYLRQLDDETGRPLIRYGPDPVVAAPAPDAGVTAAANPVWIGRRAPWESTIFRYASPSNMAETAKGPAPSPLSDVGGLGRFRRGDLIHRLLQLLPDVGSARRSDAALSLLEREHDLTPDQRAEMVAAALAVLEDGRFAAVFGPGSRAEVAVAGTAPGLPPELKISGRIDRLVVEPERVLVVDYKTNRPSPDRIEDADPDYVTQMAVYAAVLGAIFPSRRIEAALVWTDGPKLMAVPEKLMAQALLALPRSG